MAIEHFEVVTIESDRPGARLNVTNTLQVAELLVEKWPEMRGSAYRKAIQAMLTHTTGEATLDDIRAAFIAAAKEAGIFVREGRLVS